MKKNTADFSYRNALHALNVYRYESIEVLKDKKKTKNKRNSYFYTRIIFHMKSSKKAYNDDII